MTIGACNSLLIWFDKRNVLALTKLLEKGDRASDGN
jgi:hypothetical protein